MWAKDSFQRQEDTLMGGGEPGRKPHCDTDLHRPTEVEKHRVFLVKIPFSEHPFPHTHRYSHSAPVAA